VAIEESESDQGQVLLHGGCVEDGSLSPAVQKVDLATGMCTPQPSLLSQHGALLGHTAARLADGRIMYVAKNNNNSLQGTAQVLEPPPPAEHGSLSEGSWQWRYLPAMSVEHSYGRGCVLSDGRFAIFGGIDNANTPMASCEVLTLNGDIERWDPLPPMHKARISLACAAIGGCVIVAGGYGSITTEVYQEALGRWKRLPCSLPNNGPLYGVGSAPM
jgi:hypothetical protein